MPLTPKQRHRLRALAHHLDPVVQIGHEGVTGAVIAQIEEALEAHELIKVRLGTEAPLERDEAAHLITEGTRSDVAQAIGRIVVLFRRRPQKPKVDLGATRKVSGSKGRKVSRKKKPRFTRSGRTRRT